jgi:peroxin-4
MSTVSSGSSSRSASKRLLKELAAWAKEAPSESGIERLGPVSEDELLLWEAVVNGRGIGGGYDGW